MSAQKLSKSQIEAKEYVEKHSLDKILNEMLNSLIYNKCDHPTVFMINYLASKLPRSELKKAGIHIAGIKVNEPKEIPKPRSPEPEQKLDSPSSSSSSSKKEQFIQESENENLKERTSSSDSSNEKPKMEKIESAESKSSKSSLSSDEENNEED